MALYFLLQPSLVQRATCLTLLCLRLHAGPQRQMQLQHVLGMPGAACIRSCHISVCGCHASKPVRGSAGACISAQPVPAHLLVPLPPSRARLLLELRA